MTEQKNVEPLLITDLKQSQTVLDLDTQADASITLIYKKYDVNPEAPIDKVLTALNRVVSPEQKRAEALARYATSEGYQTAKAAALAKGNYLTTQLRSKITARMQLVDAYSELSASDCFKKWLTAYKDTTNTKGNASAKKLLELVKAEEDFGGM